MPNQHSVQHPLIGANGTAAFPGAFSGAINGTAHRGPFHKRLLDSPVILSAAKCAQDAMLLRTNPVENADAVEVRVGTMPGVWRSAGIYKPAKEIRVEGLSSGLKYYVEARAMGIDGVSSWSDQAICN